MKPNKPKIMSLVPFTLVLLALVGVLWAGSVSAIAASAVEGAVSKMSKSSSQPMEATFHDKLGTLSQLTGSFIPTVPGEPEESAFSFMESHREAFQVQEPREEFATLSVETDPELGTRHVYLERKINGIPVWSQRLGFHYSREGNLYSVNGKYSPSQALSDLPGLSQEQALETARADIANAPDFGLDLRKGLSAEPSMKDKDAQPTTVKFAKPGTAELVYFPDTLEKLHLAYLVRLVASSPPGDWLVFVDAVNGGVLFKYNNLQPGAAKGTGVDLYGNTVNLNTWKGTDGYKLINAAKPMYQNHSTTHPYTSFQGVIEVRDCKNAVDAKGNYVAKNNNPPVKDPNNDNKFNDTTNLRAGVSLAVNMAKAYDILRSVFNRNSVDGKGMSIIGNVHCGKNYRNGFWLPSYKMMFFGDNDPKYGVSYAKALDFVAHEMGHAVTQAMVPPDSLKYFNESGALNEAYSDMFAAITDYDDWTFAEASDKKPARYYNDPTKGDPPQPKDMYHLKMMPLIVDNGGVHFNSGIGNYFMYKLATSLPAESPAKDGRFTAGKVYYAAYKYLKANPYATFAEWGVTMKQAAKDLFGQGTAKYNKVIAALNAVYVTSAKVLAYDNGYPVADNKYVTVPFGGDNGTCATVRFTRPGASSKLKTISVGFIELENSNVVGTYQVYVCPSKQDHSPDTPNCQGPLSFTTDQYRPTDGIFVNFPLSNALTVPEEFHIGVCMEGTGSPTLWADNKTTPTGRSWLCNSSACVNMVDYFGFKGNVMIRTIMQQ